MRRLLAAVLTATMLAGILPAGVLAASAQTITWTSIAPASVPVGGTPYTPTATASSTLPVDISIDAASGNACSISAGVVTFQHVGSCTIDANQAGDTNWDAAPQEQQAITVTQGSQTVSITSVAPVSPVVGDTYAVAASATSSLTPDLTIDAGSGSVCSILNGLVTFDHPGTCTVDANQAGNADWAAAPPDQQSMVVGKAPQTITFTSSPSSPVVGGTAYTVTATGGNSGSPVTFTIDAATSAVCSISGSDVSFQKAGTCTVDAAQAGDADYNAGSAQQSFAVGKGAQTITFTSTAPAAAVVGGPTYTPTADGGATGNPVTFTIDAATSAVCSISGSDVSFQKAGTCTVDAAQAGDADYNAGSAQQSFAVGKGTQTISFSTTAPAATVGGAGYTPAATSSAGLTVALSVDAGSTSICTMVSGVVTFQHAGPCTIDANQPGDADYEAATQVQQVVTVGPAEQAISFSSTAPLDAKVGGATYTVSATGGGSGNAVTFSIDTASAGACTISGDVVSFAHTGTCVIDADQAGNADYNAAPQLQQTFTVQKGDQVVTFTSADPSPASIGGHYTPTATSTSGVAVTFTIAAGSAGVCSIGVANEVTFVAVGDCVINGDAASDADWNAAPTQAFQIGVGDRKPVCAPATPVSVTMNLASSGAANCTDADLQALTYAIGTQGTKGHAAIDASGTWTYTPNANQTGSDSFTVVANDSIIDSDPATVSVTITSHFDPRNDGVTVVTAAPSRIDVLANDSGGTGQPLTISAVSQGALGSVSTDGHGVTYDPSSCGLGTDVFTYTVTDGVAAPVTKSVFVTIARPGSSDGQGGTLSPNPVTNGPSVALATGTLGSTVPVRVAWCGAVATAVRSYGLRQSSDGGRTYPLAYSGGATAVIRGLTVGRTYAWQAITTDTSLRSGSSTVTPFVRTLLVQDSQTSTIRYSGSWGMVRSTGYSGGTERYASRTSSSASYTVVGARGFAIVSSKGIGRGSLRVYVDGRLVAVVSERASRTQYRQVIYTRALTYSSRTSHTIKVVPYGNGRVDLDAIVTLR